MAAPKRRAPDVQPLERTDSDPPENSTNGASSGETFSQVELGQRLRQARRERKLTLQQLSRQSGYSITHLSQVERGHACPTVGALSRIANALGRDVRIFLEARQLPDVSLIRREERRELPRDDRGGRLEQTAERVPGGEIQASIHSLPAAPERGAGPETAEYGRFFYVLRGRLEIDMEGKSGLWESGAAVYVAPGAAIAYRSAGADPCDLLIVTKAP